VNKTLSTFLKVAFVMLVLSGLVIGKCYEALKTKNNDYHNTITNYQIQPK
jgi:hypothetical protein